MKNMIQGFIAAAIVVALGAYGWMHYQTQQEVEAGAAYARQSSALVMQQLAMLSDGDNVTVADFFSSTRKATEELSSCTLAIDSREWRRSHSARDAAKEICSSAKSLISMLSMDAKARLERQSAKVRAEKASAAISKSKNSYEIELLTSQMNEAYDEQIKSLEQEISSIKPNASRVQAFLAADDRAVKTLGVPGLSQDARSRLQQMYPEK
ncbi:hypothetical protein OR626_23980 [Pseudomonas sp. S1Bt30]|uniref:DUF2570 domain-containing protein n=1 Tax=Pseudomonas quebecensis TaxID=2995174 RepID=A0ABY6QMS5_9PSED|nr:hypothetical protein [Pseudomonas quebecensis]MCX4067275.1 hypothetical protein [Pseudomonas quebecensis]UZW21139.1 hypothetical protein OSC50_12620 [Pseudomonas quebecensis]UZW21443.1 hypothetical protein OSC48_12860 [Pseudomonas quebecensis]UZW26502.1 hypothetical protein OSC49_12865 [Pseudomonas quebecensis]